MVLYLTYWIPASERARTGALFMMAAPIAIIVGAPISEALLQLDGRAGLAGWQWLFLVEGLPGGRARRLRAADPDRSARTGARGCAPARARVAGADDGRRARSARASASHASVFAGASSRRRCGCSATVYFLNTLVTYGVFLWLPKILRDAVGQRGLAPEPDDGDSLRRRAHRNGADRPPLRSDRRAQAPRRRLRADGGVGACSWRRFFPTTCRCSCSASRSRRSASGR